MPCFCIHISNPNEKDGGFMLTLRKMIEISEFYDFEVLAGEEGLGREVKSVTVMDAPDIYNWMKGGEFLITTGYSIKDNPKYIEFLIKKLNEKGAAGLGIKLGRFIREIPESVVHVANELRFPLIHIPVKYAFVDIINPVLSNLVNAQSRKLMYSEKIHKSFTQLVISGGNTQQIIDTLEDILEIDIIFYDLYFNKYYFGKNNDKLIKKMQNSSLENMLKEYNYYTVSIHKQNYGYIFLMHDINNETLNEYAEIALEHAATVLKLNVQNKISNLQVERRYRSEFVQDIIMKNIKSIEEVKNRAKIYGWTFDSGFLCLIVDIDNYKAQYIKMNKKYYSGTLENIKEQIFITTRKIMKKYFEQRVYTTFSDSIVFLLEAFEGDNEKLQRGLERICSEIRKEILRVNGFTVTIGIGEYKTSIMDMHESFKEAQKAIKLGRIMYNKNKTIFYNKLGIYKLLSSIYSTQDACEFCREKLKNIIEYDAKYNGNFTETLKCIVKNDWNLKSASRDMYIHYNTIKYRFNKINEILNINLQNQEEKLNIAIALKLLDMQE